MKLKKGSAAAKAYMAKIRAKRKTVKKVGSVVKKVSGTKSYVVIKYNDTFMNRYTVDVIEINKYNLRKNTDYKNTTLLGIYDSLREANKVADKIYADLNKGIKKISGTGKVYIEFLNKDKGFTKDKKFFATYDKALAYIRKNFEKADPDMIKYVNGIGKAKRSVGSSLKLSSKEKRLGYTDHKDTKSHNVNIRVVSGVDMYEERNKTEYKIKIYTSGINRLKAQLLEIKNNPFAKDNFKREGYKLEVANLNRHIKFMSKNLIVLKKQLKEQNRLISESLK